MKYQRTILCLVVLMCAVSSIAQEAVVEHTPKIVCAEPTFNFGEMENTKDVEHTFILKNEGDVSLEIRQVRPSCGCTVASISQKTIPPGGQADVTTRLSLRGRQGPQHKTISVESNDPTQPTFVLNLVGIATEELRIQPNQLFFGRITSDNSVTGMVEITIQDTNTMKVTKTESDTSHLIATTESSPDGKFTKVFVRTQPPLPRGTLRGTVHISTDHPRHPVVDIAVSAYVVDDITFAPEELPLIEQTNELASRYVLVRSESGKEFQIVSVEVPLPSMAYKIQPVETGGYQVDLSNIPTTREIDGKELRIKTDLKGVADIVIPFRLIPATPNHE